MAKQPIQMNPTNRKKLKGIAYTHEKLLKDPEYVEEYIKSLEENGQHLLDKVIRYEEALKKIVDGPGRNMTGWKFSWAHDFASRVLTSDDNKTVTGNLPISNGGPGGKNE